MFTKIECGECGGDYMPGTPNYFQCGCGHTVHVSDLTLDEGETLTVRADILGYITEEA